MIIIASSFGCVDTKGKIEEIPGEFINTLEKEAPILAAKVRDGKIPSLSERIPQNPLVAKHDYIGYEGPGVYGGTWRHFHNDTNLGPWKMIGGYVPLIRWNDLWS